MMSAFDGVHPVSAVYFKNVFAGQMRHATSLGGSCANVAAPTLGM
jgi:hypothetical protein